MKIDSVYLSTGKSHDKPIFWSAPSSAFSGKLRGFIAKSGLQVEERFANEPRFHEEIVPLIGYFVIPVIELEDGLILQDTTEAILYFEHQAATKLKRSLIPTTPLLKAVAHLINLLGSDGFHKPGMHYRWSYEDRQEGFLDSAFADWVAPRSHVTRKEQTASFTSDYLPGLGIRKETISVIEKAWEECLDILNNHFKAYPYFLGAAPTIADCGFMTMVWAHLARDPVPAYLMRTRAPSVARWAERMVQLEWFDGGYPTVDPSLAHDTIPETLIPFLKYLFVRIVPEHAASVVAFNKMMNQKPQLRSGDYLDDPSRLGAHPTCGKIEFELLGTVVERMAFVDSAFQFQTFSQALQDLSAEDRKRFITTMSIGGSILASLLRSKDIVFSSVRLSALVRSEQHAKVLSEEGIDVVHFDDTNAINQFQKIGAGFDIIIDPAFTFQPSYCEALIAGQGQRKVRTAQEVYYIHQSGTSNIANQPITKGFTETRTYSDKENIFAYQRFRESVDTFGQRTSDLAVLDAGLREGVKTTSVMSPLIFGKGTGYFNRTTIQVPLLVGAAIKSKQAVVVGDGLGSWNLVSIDDLCSLYAILLSRIVSGQGVVSGEQDLLFSENGTFTWLELSQTIADVGVQLGVLKTKEISHLSPEQAAEVLFPFPSVCEVGLGSTSLTKADLAREYGWQPVHTKKDLLEGVRSVFESAIAASK
ncbi:Glutathione S-transferase, domain-containing protein [Cladophialophora immunda]|nr:Glutathione S-transferase, domain-containing protein [Cladophialophora immunda]